jgi:hypothetical protein
MKTLSHLRQSAYVLVTGLESITDWPLHQACLITSGSRTSTATLCYGSQGLLEICIAYTQKKLAVGLSL